MMGLQVSCTIDMTGLQAGIEAAMRYTKRTLPQLVNTSAYWVAINARKETRYVTAERVDRDMGTVVTARIGKRGKPLSMKSSKGRVLVSSKSLMMENGKMVPRAAAIIAARASATSKYNSLTAGRWALGKNPFKGVSRAAGQAAMAALVHRMLASRRGSGQYLLAGWLPAISILFPHVQHKFLQSDERPARKGIINFDLGTGTVAAEGNQCSSMVQNAVGMQSRTGPKANQALVTYVTDALQSAVNNEGKRQMEYALKKAEAEMAKETEKFWR